MQAGNCPKVMKLNTQGHSQKRDHCVQRTASGLVGTDIRVCELGKISGRIGDTCLVSRPNDRMDPDCEAPCVSYYEASGNLQKWE